jgi:hypothetical protein
MAQVSFNNRRTFRFPRPAMFLMLLGFAGTVLAIEMGRTISMGGSADTTSIYPVLRALLAVLAVPCVAVAIGYVISFVQQRKPRPTEARTIR